MSVESWHSYILGLLTLPVLALVGWGVIQIDYSVRHWGRQRCGLCGRWLPWGPRWLYKPFHARFRHGLAVTMRGRVRKRQLHGMAWWYARKHGFSKEEWDAAIAPHREEYNRRVREDDRRWREEQGDK